MSAWGAGVLAVPARQLLAPCHVSGLNLVHKVGTSKAGTAGQQEGMRQTPSEILRLLCGRLLV